MGILGDAKIATAKAAIATYLLVFRTCLEGLDAKSSTHAQVDQALKESLERAAGQDARFPDPILYYGDKTQLFLSNPNIQAVYETLQGIEQAPLQEIAEFLKGVIEQRARQDDLWPDGRLHLGIAYAVLNDYEAARNTLEEVIEICESGGRYLEKNIAMAV